jgi:hypothetical protein
MWYCLFMERVPFPGLTDTRIAERKIKRILMPAISKDGVCLHFTKTFYPDNPEKRTPYIELLVREGLSIQINNRVLEDMGQGDLEAGLAVIADSLCDLDYAGLRVGDGEMKNVVNAVTLICEILCAMLLVRQLRK